MSHPSRVRELKLELYINGIRSGAVSHPSRVRELKLDTDMYGDLLDSRTPPGCVN